MDASPATAVGATGDVPGDIAGLLRARVTRVLRVGVQSPLEPAVSTVPPPAVAAAARLVAAAVPLPPPRAGGIVAFSMTLKN